MKISELFLNIEKEVFGNENIEIKGLSYDSRKIFEGYIFFALNLSLLFFLIFFNFYIHIK